MKKLLVLTVVLALVSFGLFFTSCDNAEGMKNLLEVARETEGMESLIVVIDFIEENLTEAVIREDLANDSLTFTVFAPDNEAFVDFFEAEGTVLTETDIVESWMAGLYDTDAEFAEELLNLLGLHVIEDQELFEFDIIAADNSSIGPTLYGDGTTYLNVAVDIENIIRLDPDTEKLGDHAYIETTDIEASNGVAHIINAVMYPEPS